MPHGGQEYFLERARFERRLSLTISGLSLLLLALQGVLLLPPVHRSVVIPLMEGPLSARRFGFEGPEQFVRRVYLMTSGPPGPHPGQATIVFRSAHARKGGRPDTEASNDPHARPDTRPLGQGPGESIEDLVARARVLYGGSAPVMQSEDLIIEELVRPDYPQEARDRNIEGLVALVALVDTTGGVARVNVMSSTGEHLLEEAAAAAVRRCRFRPYRVDGRASEVFAVFRFAFRIYD